MKNLRKPLSLLLALILCYSFSAMSFADDGQEFQPYAQLRLSPSLSATRASVLGSSSSSETVTVSFTLYTSSGSYITSGSATGLQYATASKKVDLEPGSYRISATVSNGSSSTSQSFTLTI